MSDKTDPIEIAQKRLFERRIFRLNGRELVVAFLVRQKDWRPLKADWWTGKEVCIVGVDLEGNFFLRHCDGSVRFWDHSAQRDEIIASSISSFVDQLR